MWGLKSVFSSLVCVFMHPCIFSADRAVEVIVGTDSDRPAEWELFFNSGLLSVWGVRGKHRHTAPQRLCWGPNSISASRALRYWNSFQKKRWRVVSHSFAWRMFEYFNYVQQSNTAKQKLLVWNSPHMQCNDKKRWHLFQADIYEHRLPETCLR